MLKWILIFWVFFVPISIGFIVYYYETIDRRLIKKRWKELFENPVKRR